MTEEYEYNGFKYLMDYSLPESNIKISHNKQIPEYLFKFYSINEFSVDALIKSYIYASHPFELNDIMDSSPFLLYTSKPLSLDVYEKFFSHFRSKEEIIKIWENDSNKENKCRDYLTHIYSVTSNLIGVISLTAKENNLLMWPHYAQEKGIQLKLRTSNLINSITENVENEKGEFLGLNPINYCQKLNPIDVHPYKTFFVPIAYATNVKSNMWEYEDEWRILVSKHDMGVPHSKSGLNIIPDHIGNKENRKISYSKEIVEEICLGFNFIVARDFNIKRINDLEFEAQPIKGKYNYENYIKLLTYISDNLSDRLFYSGVKYELDDEQKLFLIRTKEKLEIKKINDEIFHFTRTNNIIRLLE
ncbi:DUF2971 domain-containing protein [Chryseobacterium potabilaquae]|uniref:DUF2971 domain-containing protein n=1 Tax=Chryseobacterium potabilaquae TaxID=2675057 RepID=A0A6N4X1H7_9FLAO|nr:DUF2971 domain-containing protein [Chryseobacterium potabilaquae]CAA7194676.1 hypothetical protein CHRY9293_00964 [Chryseobacterium potabilaquae]